MHNSWICSVRDVLSVILDSEACLSFSLRIRNCFEDGRAELVSFRFRLVKKMVYATLKIYCMMAYWYVDIYLNLAMKKMLKNGEQL